MMIEVEAQSKKISIGCGVTSRSRGSRGIPFGPMDARGPLANRLDTGLKTDHRQHFLFLVRFLD